MKQNCSKFMRGQIWQWNDPVYGPKSDGFAIPDGEELQRYSRPVLIVGNADCVVDGTLQVMPLTTRQDHAFAVPITMPIGKSSFIRANRIMTVSCNNIGNYVCSISPEIMEMVDNMIGYIYCNHTLEDDWFQANFIRTKEGNLYRKPIRASRAIANDIACKAAIPVIQDLPDPTKALAEMQPISELPVDGDSDIETVTTASSAKLKSGRSPKWSSERKFKLIEAIDENGIDNAAKEFKLSLLTIKKYEKQFRKDLAADIEGGDNSSDASEVESIPSAVTNVVYSTNETHNETHSADEKMYQIDTEFFKNAISSYSNMVTKYCKESYLSNTIALWKLPTAPRHINMTDTTFYDCIGNCIYKSLLEYFKFSGDYKNLIPTIPNIYESSPIYTYVNMMMGIGKLNLRDKASPKCLIGEWNKKGICYKMPHEWLESVEEKIRQRLQLTDKGYDKIMSVIGTFAED